MNPLADALRKRQEAERARSRGLQFGNTAAQAGPNVVSGGANAPAAINWGSIIQQGVGSYQSAKSEKQANSLDQEADALSQQFMAETFKNDPESYRLMQMAQADIPGAAEALSQRVAPKKEALGAFLQHLQSGVADEDMVKELAPRYGLTPELASRAAQVANQKKMEEEQRAHAMQLEEIQARRAGARSSGAASGNLSFQEYMSLTPEQQEAYNKFKGRKGSTTEGGLTPGERNVRAKSLQELDKELQTLGVQESKYQNLRPKLEDPDAFGPKQKLAQILAESDNGLISGVGTAMRSEEAMLLEDYLNDEVLRRMSMLGGNDSNEELNRMRASLPKVLNDQKAALELMDQLEQWQMDTKEAVRRRREAMQSGDYFNQDLESRDFYKEVKDAKAAAPAQPAAPAAPAAPKGKIKILSIQ